MKGYLKAFVFSLMLVIGDQSFAASPNIRPPRDNNTRLADCSIWLCLPMGFSNGDCSRAMAAFSARQVRVMYKRLFTDLPLARFCYFDQYVKNDLKQEQTSNSEALLAQNLSQNQVQEDPKIKSWDLLDWIFPKAMAQDVSNVDVPDDVNYSESEYGKFGGDDPNDPDLGHSFTTTPMAVIDEQRVCLSYSKYLDCASNGTHCKVKYRCNRSGTIPYQEFLGENCSKVSEPIYASGLLADSGTRTSKGRKFCNKVYNRTCVYVRGELQGSCYDYLNFEFYKPQKP